MAKQAARQTEIDHADDLILPVGEVPGEEQEEAPLPAVEEGEVSEEVDKIALPSPGEEEAERRPPAGEVSPLVLYGVPAVGAVLILALGWVFAFIARSGLTPPPSPSTAKVAPARPGLRALLEKKPSRPVAVPKDGEQEKALDVDVPEPVKELEGSFAVSLQHPFFIPLEGGKRRGKDGMVFLRMALSLEVSSKAAASEINAKRAVLRKVVFDHFNRFAPRQLTSTKGREEARKTLMARLAKEVAQGEVKRIFFREFLTR